ncbi:unnamed protein product [Rotaria sordida]|uniref:Uncharacterized protein n=1 Tax=Rotaria sordida TaxID=392033 RepID=A0A814MZL8_9BILA|nr:unnamed protein product [Rotaria sordida]CAF1086520.1 unnamed protein product [Rotaria sordida]CAF3491183.1 unnamed protein product [Rotaria sordida]CAF3938882.1 unnamed protein product [Rotaria sordida]
MILAAAACAVAGAAGLSHIFDDNNDEQQATNMKYETVTVSSTIPDKQGIVKYVIHPYSYMYYPFIKQEQNKCIVTFINKYKLNQLKLPIENYKEKMNYSLFKQDFSIIFFWSIPLKAHLLQTSTKSCFIKDNFNIFERSSIKISIGIQNEINENIGMSYISSEIALSNYDQYSYQTNRQKQSLTLNNDEYNNTFDSLSYNPIINDNIIPIGILKKKKSNINENENNQKRFCYDKILNSNHENLMRNIILENVNLCVENLSKILNESCSNNEKQLTTLYNSSSFISLMNNNNNKLKSSIRQDIYKNKHSDLFQHEESLDSLNNENNNTNPIEQLSDGIILHRGKRFGRALGEPVIRKYNENEQSSHSINELNRLLSKTNCLLMRQQNIESIEDLIRLFLEQGQQNFTEIMINLFKVDPFIVEQINLILIKWAKKLT